MKPFATDTLARLLSAFLITLALLIPRVAHAQTLVARWTFDGNANDATGNGHNGTIIGSRVIPTTDRFGNLNSALNFDGGFIRVPASTAFNNNNMTLSAWVKFCTFIYGDQLIVGKAPTSGNSNTRDDGYVLGIIFHTSPMLVDAPGYGVITSRGTVIYISNPQSPNIADGRWHHIVCTIKDSLNFVAPNGDTTWGTASVFRVYLDGQFVRQRGPAGLEHIDFTGNQEPLYIAGDTIKPSYFRGALDDIRLYNGALTDAQIAALYSEGGWPNVTYPDMGLSLSALGPLTLCTGDSVQLQALLTGSGQSVSWSPANGLRAIDTTNPRPWVHPSTTTTYTVRGSSGEPCPEKRAGPLNITITVNDPPKPSFSFPPPLCRGDSMRLAPSISGGTQPFRYAWTPATTIDDPTLAQPRVWPKTTTRYYLTVTDANGCTGRDSVTVTVYAPPTANAGRDTVLCRGSAVKIGTDSLDNHRYTWSPRAGLNDSTLARPIAKPDTTTRYIMLVTAPTGCKAYDTIIVKVNPAATADAGVDATICSDSSAVIGTAKQAGYSYQWTPAAGLNDPKLAQPTAKPSATTTYYLAATNSSGCTATDSVTVTVLKPALQLDRATLDFGQLDGCTSSRDASVVVSNSGTSDVRIAGIGGQGSGFSLVSPTLPIDLKPGEKVTLVVRYAPTGSGASSGTLTLLGTPCNASTSIALSGSKEQSLVSADRASIDFGRSLSCSSVDSTVTITITNSGGASATIDATTLAAPFSISSPSLLVTIAAGTTQKIVVYYKPTAAGSYSTELRLPYTSGTCRDTLRIALSGIVEQPALTPSSATLDFGTLSGCDVGHDTTITLVNSGTFDITLDSASIPADFKLTTALPLTIPAGQSRTITVRFEPATSGGSSGTIALHYSPCDETLILDVSGTKQGVSFATADSLNFGEVITCRESSKSIKESITYNGDTGTNSSIASVSINGPFTTTMKPGDVLANGAATPFSVTFAPSQDGSATGALDVVLAPCDITRHIALTGSRASIQLIPSSLNFGTQPLGSSMTKEVILINRSGTSLTVDHLDNIVPPFSIASTVPALPATLQPGDTLHILVQFIATTGASHDTLHAVVATPCSIAVDATLDGSGEDAATATITLLMVDAVPGEHITLPLTLKSSSNLDGLGAYQFVTSVAFNRTLLMPSGTTPLGVEQGHERIVTITGSRPAGMASGELARLEFTAALGDTNYTPVAIKSFRWVGVETQVATEDGGVHITSPGGWKQFLPSGTLTLLVLPNPASTNATIIYEVIEPGRTRLVMRDALGREIATLVDADVKPGRYSIEQDVTGLAAGKYFYELATPSGRLVESLVVLH